MICAPTMPALAHADAFEANKAFFAEQVTALGVDSTSKEAEAAIRAAAIRAGEVRLDLLIASASHQDATATGDIWIFELGFGPCPSVEVIADGVPASNVHPQGHVYKGVLGTQTTTGTGMYVAWTTKTAGVYDAGVTVTGQSDFWCTTFWGVYLYYPFLTGVMTTNPH